MKKITIMMMTVCLCASTAIFAVDGTWNNAAGGAWETAGNWTGNTIADGAGNTATFSADTAPVAVDANRTIGVFSSSAPAGFWVNNGPLVLDGGTPAIDITGGALYFNCQLAGSSGFDKTGAGWLLQYNTTISGDINVNAGVLGLMWDDAIMNADVIVNNGGSLYINNGVAANGQSVTINTGGVLQPFGGTATLNAPLTLNRPESFMANFAVHVPTAAHVMNLDGNITLTVNTEMSVDANASTININAPISGAFDLKLLGRGGIGNIGVYNINAPCTYTGSTFLHTWGSNPRYEMGVNDALPCGSGADQIKLEVVNSLADAGVTLDLNDKTQRVNKLLVALNGGQTGHKATITGSDAGVLEIINGFSTWEGTADATTLKLTGGKIICNGSTQFGLAQKMIITNATLIQNTGWGGGANASFELQAGAKIGGTGFLSWNTGDSVDLVIPDNVTITPGNSIGTVGCWNLEMQDGSEYDWEVGTAGVSDMVDVRGDLDISAGVDSVTINVIDAGSPNGEDYVLFRTDWGGGSINGASNNVKLVYGAGVAGPTYPRIEGSLVVASIVPEPGIIGLLSLLGLAILRRK